MKIINDSSVFRPVTIMVETRAEALAIREALAAKKKEDHAADAGIDPSSAGATDLDNAMYEMFVALCPDR